MGKFCAIIFSFAFLLMFYSCQKEEQDDFKNNIIPEILTFSFIDAGPFKKDTATSIISDTNIIIYVPPQTNVTNLTAIIGLNKGSVVTPPSNTTLDYSLKRNFIVTNNNQKKIYAVVVHVKD